MLYLESNPEVVAKLAAQRRNSTIASLITGVLLMLLLALLFWIIGIQIFSERVEPIAVFSEESLFEDEIEQEKVQVEVKKTPSPPSSSSSMAPVIAAVAESDFSITVPDVTTDTITTDFGASEGFGTGWGAGNGNGSGSGNGFGKGGGGAFSFMGSKMKGEKICFVMDYSASMRGGRIELLKNELTKTIESLPNRTQYQMILFAGPAWVAGSTVHGLKSGSSHATHDGLT